MSASSKKKLRNAQKAEKLTEKQLQEKKEAKKLKIYSIALVVVVVLMAVFAVGYTVSKSISNSGIRERNTTAVQIGEHKLSNAELNYYYIDSINQFYNNYGSYATLFGLDVTKPLNEQVTNEETGTTWADDFLSSAEENAKAIYAVTDEAAANGYALSDEELAAIDSEFSNMELYAMYYYGYPDFETYLKAVYGNGATLESYRAYYEQYALYQSYQSHYTDSLTYTDADLRAAEAENYNEYSAFSYNTYYMSTSKFLEGGTTDEEGKTTYSDEETAASVTAAEQTAKALAEGEYESAADLDAAIAALEINAEVENASSTAYTNSAYSSINTTIQEWVTDSNRQAGDITYIPSVSHTHAEGETHSDDEDSSEFDTVTGYYVVYFVGSNDNIYPLADVRHILVSFEGGTTDSSGNTTYSDEEKAAAWETAQELLTSWKNGDATEESFAALANEKSADSDGTDGGLYTDVYPGQMVTNFNDWCFAEGRQPGDTGIVESPYGYHVMYYSGDSETMYRDYLIESALISADTTEWYNDLVEAVTVTELNTNYISKDLVLSNG